MMRCDCSEITTCIHQISLQIVNGHLGVVASKYEVVMNYTWLYSTGQTNKISKSQ